MLTVVGNEQSLGRNSSVLQIKPNKSRVTVSMLTGNMWREDHSSSQVLELKLVMQHLLNGLNYVATLVTNQMQSGAPSDLISPRSFA